MLLKLVVVAVVVVTASCVSISLPECGPKFYCPDNCNISYINNCPHNCNCKPIKFCPEVKCPAKAPGCIIVTKEDGCQTCVCHQPVIQIKSTSLGSEDTEFLFFDKNDFTTIANNNNTENVTSAAICTVEDMDQVDQCILKTVNYKKFVKRRKDDAVATVNPLVQIHQQELGRMCSLYNDGLACLGRDLYDRCRLVHFDLAQIDAFLGFPCGPKQVKFFQHYPCIQDTHKRSARLQLCEDLLTASLLQLSQSTANFHEKQQRKCSAMKWFISCERPNVYRHCSNEAADIYTLSLKSAAEYITPGCNEEFTHEAFAPKPEVESFSLVDTNLTNATELIGDNFNSTNETVNSFEFGFENFNLTIEGVENTEFNETSLNETSTRPLKIYVRPSWLNNNVVNGQEVVEIDSNDTSNLSDSLQGSPTVHRTLLLPRTRFLRDAPDDALNLESLKKPEQKVKKEEILRHFNPNWPTGNETEFNEISGVYNRSVFLLESLFENETLQYTNVSNINETNLLQVELSAEVTDKISSTSRPVFVRHRWVYVNETLAPKENLTCKREYQKIIDSKFNNLFAEIRDKSKSASLSFPLAYAFSKSNLKARCETYQNAIADIPSKAKKACATNYEVYDQVQNVFGYPCGWGSETYFFLYFECLNQARTNDIVKQCEYDANEYLKDPSLDQCQAYGLFIDCIYDNVVRRCGYDGWEVTFQFLSQSVKNYVQDCTLPRLYRAVV